MKFSTLAVASFASTALAQTFYETRVHYITVDAEGHVVGSTVSTEGIEAASSTEAAAAFSTVAPTTVVIDFTTSSSAVSSSPVTPSPVTSSTSTSSPATSSPATSSPATTSTVAPSTQEAAVTASSTFAQAAAETSSSTSSSDDSFASSMLEAHNSKRADHSASLLTWDTTVYNYAQAYADKYVCGAGLVHSGGKYGENLASGYSSGVAAFDAWYSEGDNYDYSTATTFNHFTAIIWKGTSKLGCAYKDCGDDGLYVICSYDTAGNVVGFGKENLSAN